VVSARQGVGSHPSMDGRVPEIIAAAFSLRKNQRAHAFFDELTS
jgi:hypothetical protein